MPKDSKGRVFVVGIGASAGGLEAFTRLLRHLPTDTGMAFVLVQHLDPARESALTDLLLISGVCLTAHAIALRPNPSVQLRHGILRQLRG